MAIILLPYTHDEAGLEPATTTVRRFLSLLFLLTGIVGLLAAQVPRPAADPVLTILVSFDGWRWDYDSKAPAPALRALMARGVRAEGLVPGFPSKTIPNHY